MELQMNPVTLSGTHVELVPLDLSHQEDLCKIGLDSELWKLTTNEIRTPADMQNYVATALNDRAAGTSLPFVIIEKSSGKIIGSSRYHSYNKANRRLVIGHTWISGQWQRTFVNTEIKYLMLKHAFENLNCQRVEFIVNSINDRSRRALLRIGAKQEALLRNYSIGKNSEGCDVALFSIIDLEWPQIKTGLENKLSRTTQQSDVARSYDMVAEEYAAEFKDELANKPFDRKMIEWLVEKTDRRGPYCDMGCGPGQIARYLNDLGVEAFGIDISGEMVEQAKLLNPDVRFEQGSMLSLGSVSDNSLGGIAAFYSLLHLDRKYLVPALLELHRTLRPGGVLLTALHIGSQVVHRDEWFGKEVSIDFLFFETQEMKDNLQRAGFTLEEVVERDPYVGFEYPSRRVYTFARK